MKRYIEDFIKDIEEKLNNNYKFKEQDIVILKDKISFFNHERLIHLLVTLFYAIFLIAFIFLSILFPLFLIPCLAILVFLFFYVKHYFFLENSVQYLYKLYDKILK